MYMGVPAALDISCVIIFDTPKSVTHTAQSSLIRLHRKKRQPKAKTRATKSPIPVAGLEITAAAALNYMSRRDRDNAYRCKMLSECKYCMPAATSNSCERNQ